MNVMRIIPAHGAWRSGVWWVLASMIGFGLAGVLFHFPAGFPPNTGGQVVPGNAVMGAVQGALSGAVVGLFQWPVLRQWHVRAGPWIGATAVGVGVVHAVGDALPDAIALPIIQLSGGMVLGLLQWLLLRRVVPTAWWWGGTSSIGWAIGLSAGLSIAYASGLMHGPWTPTTGMLQHGVVGAVTGIGYGVLTGSALVRETSAGAG